MFVLIVGCGRVGSAIAKSMLAEGHEVSVLDEDPGGHRAARPRPGRGLGGPRRPFTVGTALEIDALLAAGIEQADAFVASTDGDNTNLVIAQIAKRRFEIERVVVRVLDPASRALVRRAGPPDGLPHPDRDRAAGGRGARPDPLRGSVRLDVRPDRRGAEGRLEPGSRADRQGPRGHGHRVRPRPLRGGRGGARAQRPVRRRLRALGPRARRHRARRPGDRRDRATTRTTS